MSFLSSVGGGIKGLAKRTAGAATGGVVAGSVGATLLQGPDEITAIITALTGFIAIIGNLAREYYKYKQSLKVVT